MIYLQVILCKEKRTSKLYAIKILKKEVIIARVSGFEFRKFDISDWFTFHIFVGFQIVSFIRSVSRMKIS